MNEQEVLQVLGEVDAVITDSHVVYDSGKHGAAYFNKDAIYPHTRLTSRLCQVIAKHFKEDKVEAVIAPAIGGAILSQWVAYHLTGLTGREVFGSFAEKERNVSSFLKKEGRLISFYHCFDIFMVARTLNNKLIEEFPSLTLSCREGDDLLLARGEETFIIKRGYNKLVAGKNVLVVEDTLTAGGSAKKVIEATRAIGGNVVGLGVLCNRGEITPQDVTDVPKLFALVNIKFDAWDEADCPLCGRGIPINTDVGKGREYLVSKKAI